MADEMIAISLCEIGRLSFALVSAYKCDVAVRRESSQPHPNGVYNTVYIMHNGGLLESIMRFSVLIDNIELLLHSRYMSPIFFGFA